MKHGREQIHKDDTVAKSLKRDFAFDDMSTSVTSKDMRGIGHATKTFVVAAAQKDAQLALHCFENSLLKVNSVMKSKHSQHDIHMELAKLYMAMGDKVEAKKELELAKVSMTEISALEDVAMNLKDESKNTQSGEANSNDNQLAKNKSG